MLEAVVRGAASGGSEADRVRIRHRTLLQQLGLNSELLDRYLREFFRLLAVIRQRGRVELAELDYALSFGERMSARIFARVLNEHGLQATPVDAWDVGFLTDSTFGQARPLDGIGRGIRKALAEVPGIPVVTGFLAKDKSGALTTLGRNGSDLTASVLAEAIGAAEIQFWKNVGGILTADPLLVPEASVIERLTYAEAEECAFHGARILHPGSVAPTVRAQVKVRVCDVHEPTATGTVLEDSLDRSGPIAIASRDEAVIVNMRIDEPERRAEMISELFRGMGRRAIVPGMVTASGRGMQVVCEPGPAFERFLAELRIPVQVERGYATLAVVGRGVGKDRNLGQRIMKEMRTENLPFAAACLETGAESQSIVLRQQHLGDAVRHLHRRLISPDLSVHAGAIA
ncbi:MAG: aspartate kinase [Planctomycetota bacterium]|jgi:aspartate kinase